VRIVRASIDIQAQPQIQHADEECIYGCFDHVLQNILRRPRRVVSAVQVTAL
jgi:hypothetical protein